MCQQKLQLYVRFQSMDKRVSGSLAFSNVAQDNLNPECYADYTTNTYIYSILDLKMIDSYVDNRYIA